MPEIFGRDIYVDDQRLFVSGRCHGSFTTAQLRLLMHLVENQGQPMQRERLRSLLHPLSVGHFAVTLSGLRRRLDGSPFQIDNHVSSGYAIALADPPAQPAVTYPELYRREAAR